VGEKLEQIRIVRLAEGDPTDAETVGWHALRTSCAAESEEGQAEVELPSVAALLRSTRTADRSLRWLAWDGGRAVGFAWLRLFDHEGRRHLGRFRVAVHPEHRGRGIGTALLARVRDSAAAEGRGSLLTSVATGSPCDAFLAAAGFDRVADVRRLRLRVADCDREALRSTVKAASAGYHLARWQGVAPADLIGPFAAARRAMIGLPAEGMDNGRTDWDEGQVRALAQDVAARGHSLLTVAALCTDNRGTDGRSTDNRSTDGQGADNEGGETVAGFSEIVLPGGGANWARQSDTAVLKEHRGHGLGLWVKAAMLQWLTGAHPEVREVVTSCLVTNRHMIAINEELGFLPDGDARYYQLAQPAPTRH
jgi:GNAT superfamily N-acetyltransferase